MTGNGTQESPFVPTNWNDFVTAIGTRGAFVECVEGTEWDLNEVSPNGISGVINVYATKVVGNGLVIKNLYYSNVASSELFNIESRYNSIDIYDINFLNCVLLNRHSFADIALFASYNVKICGVSVSAVVLGTSQTPSEFIDLGGASYATGSLTFGKSPYSNKGCDFNILSNSKYLFVTGLKTATISESFIKHRGYSTVYSRNTQSYVSYNNCLIQGRCTGSSGEYQLSGNQTIFDMISEGITSYKLPEGYILLANRDKIGVSPNIPRPSTEQLKDVAYLRNVGFPIGES